ncbi:uncharacterized protein LOC103008269 isoform X5 [Balaenoptera acutorostrata]|uniref:Uncharacterized protein LOC103008269 isoform X5 n=1 Tax=Balaenoptera acutorostrata TaxID=9767 RepID=A0ABM3TJI6_BALAC|nr:uncharacterized protein LOC103008269 isoform X5 [Balaenoptera acutorostrata]
MADFLASDLASEPPGLQGGHHRAWRRLKFTATEVPAREGLQSYDGDLHLGFLGAHTACPSVLDLVASQARSPHHCHLQVLFTGWLEWLLLAHVDPWMPHEPPVSRSECARPTSLHRRCLHQWKQCCQKLWQAEPLLKCL